VPKYLERHCESPRTLERYQDAWKWLALWLQTKRYHSPKDITYRNAIEYVDWRTSYKKKTGKTVGRNTAILELKTLAMIMGEAVLAGVSYSTAREWFRVSGFPVFRGVVFWQDFERWRVIQTGLRDLDNRPSRNTSEARSPASGMSATDLPPQAARIVAEFG
jgi:hypothetical protein